MWPRRGRERPRDELWGESRPSAYLANAAVLQHLHYSGLPSVRTKPPKLILQTSGIPHAPFTSREASAARAGFVQVRFWEVSGLESKLPADAEEAQLAHSTTAQKPQHRCKSAYARIGSLNGADEDTVWWNAAEMGQWLPILGGDPVAESMVFAELRLNPSVARSQLHCPRLCAHVQHDQNRVAVAGRFLRKLDEKIRIIVIQRPNSFRSRKAGSLWRIASKRL